MDKVMCGMCKEREAQWFSHAPEDCRPGVPVIDEETGENYGDPIDCDHEPECHECTIQHVLLIDKVYQSKN